MKVATALALLLATGTASAGVGASFMAQATRYGDQPNRNIGANVELSLDRGRWRPFAELGVLAFSLGDEVLDGRAGTMWRGGGGIRILAHRLDVASIELDQGFEVLAAAEHLRFDGGASRTRPELAAGWVWSFGVGPVAMQTSVRVFVTPSPSRTVACRGVCPGTDVATTGFMVATGVAW